jgi:hypothetical protein
MSTFVDIAPTIAKLVRLLASDKPGEIVASVHTMRRVLRSAELDLHDLANVVEFSARRGAPQIASTIADDDDAREMIRLCCERSELLTSKEFAFVRSVASWRGELSSRQFAWLCAIYERLEGGHA